MDGSTVVPLIGCAIVVVVASLRAPSEGSVRVALSSFAISTVASAALIGAFIRWRGYLPDTLSTSLTLYGASQLSAAKEKNVIVLDGGSYPARGIDERVLARALAKRGYSVRVVHLAMSAGNHFERYTMYQDILRRVARSIPAKRRVFMAEVHSGYDTIPFAQLERNQDTARAYHYMTPQNAFFGLAAVYFGGGNRVFVERLPWVALRHALVNGFNVGMASLAFEDAPANAHSGYIGGIREPRYAFPGLGAVIQSMQGPPKDVKVPSWLFSVRERRARQLWAPRDFDWVYYGMPSTSSGTGDYIRCFCAMTKDPCIVPDPDLLVGLDRADKWFNAGHLSSAGAVVYSEWLAAKLDEKGVLQK
jgi:hypothetical protein